jgi:glycerol-3-phosphate dehydrogenase
VLNAAGPWVDQVASRLSRPPARRAFHLSKAINLVTRQLFRDVAVGLQGRSAFRDTDAAFDKGFRLFFIVPWRRHSLIGTRHFPHRGGPDDLRISESEIRSFLDEINAAYPPARLAREDVVGVYRGMLPRDPAAPAEGEVQLEKHGLVIDHEEEDGFAGLVTLVGVKWTTARLVAEQVVSLIGRKLGRPPAVTGRDAGRVVGGDIPDLAGFLERARSESPAGMPPESVEHVLECYGTESRRIFDLVAREPSLGRPLTGSSPVVAAQVVHAARAEMALHLDDVVLRRTELGLAGDSEEVALEGCARLMARELGWTPATERQEVDRARGALAGFRSRA